MEMLVIALAIVGGAILALLGLAKVLDTLDDRGMVPRGFFLLVLLGGLWLVIVAMIESSMAYCMPGLVVSILGGSGLWSGDH